MRQSGFVCMIQGFYMNMVYHSYAITYGGDTAVLNETGWVQDWVSLMTQVLESDVCKVCLLDHYNTCELPAYKLHKLSFALCTF